MTITNKMLALAALAAGCLCMAGCIVRERPVYYSAPPGAVVVEGEPPPPMQEEIIAAPGPEVDFIWIPGWWWWDGRWVWHGGYWGHKPHAGAIWVPHAWVRGSHGWVHHGGHWR